jgi:AcrR family transcriptional regulator
MVYANNRGQETKLRILDAAIEEFSKAGFYGARVDNISEKAGVNKQRVYAYYESKENLYCEVLKTCYESIVEEEQVFQEICDSEVENLAETVMRHYIDFHLRNPHFWRLLAWENLRGGTNIKQYKDIRQKTMNHIRGLFDRAQKSGVFRKDVSFESFFYMLSALTFFYFSNQKTMRYVLDMDLGEECIRERIVSECLAMLSLSGG